MFQHDTFQNVLTLSQSVVGETCKILVLWFSSLIKSKGQNQNFDMPQMKAKLKSFKLAKEKCSSGLIMARETNILKKQKNIKLHFKMLYHRN